MLLRSEKPLSLNHLGPKIPGQVSPPQLLHGIDKHQERTQPSNARGTNLFFSVDRLYDNQKRVWTSLYVSFHRFSMDKRRKTERSVVG